MKYPTLYARQQSQETQDMFAGYNHNVRIGDGEFFDMMNLASDNYPVLAPRKKRGLFAQGVNVQGMIAKDSLCYIDGHDFVINEYHVDMNLSTEAEDCPKQLISMGAYVIIMPDKKYFNTADFTDYGNIEAEVTNSSQVSFIPCKKDGTEYTADFIQSEEPESPENMALWVDTSTEPHSLKQYSSSTSMWAGVATTYVKIHSAGIGAPFAQFDGVKITGISDHENTQIAKLEGTAIVYSQGEDFIVVAGIIDSSVSITSDITVSRKMPLMDFVIENENRLWGCRYGLNADGEVVNELYCCKLGDFKNWNCFMGISTDSYVVSLGSDGQFTGAISYAGHPLFWKENCLHDVYGQIPANFQVQTTACRGVQKGCSRSLAIINEILYYKARHAVCAYDGSLPTEVSAALGEERYQNAVAAAYGNKYYISMEKADGTEYVFMVLDVAKGLWYKEDNLRAYLLCSCRDELYCVTEDNKIITILGSGESYEYAVEWMAESGIIGANYPNRKFLKKLNIRMVLEFGSELNVFVQYDSAGDWDNLLYLRGKNLQSFTIPVIPKRCDHLRLRLKGKGKFMLFSITKTFAHGSDKE